MMETKEAQINTISQDNIYQLNGRVPLSKAIPFGLQHVLAMFVANLAPIVVVAGAAGLAEDQTAMLVQSAMLIAGIGTLIQLFPVWRIGSGLPIVMGIAMAASSCFLTPIATPPNTIVLGPGGYKFVDYIKAGWPLQVIALLMCWLLIPMIWPFHP